MGSLARWFLIGLVAAAAARAQDAGPAAPAPPPPAPPGAPGHGFGADPGTLFRLARQMDLDGDLLVDEKELQDGFRRLAEDAARVRENLIAWLDKDGDGTLNADEWRPLYMAMGMLGFIRAVDRNRDLALDENELQAARTRLADFCQKANSYTLRQYDRDHDGELSKDEVHAARKAMRRFFPPPGPGPGAGAAPVPMPPRLEKPADTPAGADAAAGPPAAGTP